MVRALDRKLLRDLAQMKGQVLTIALVVACGIATFLTFVGAYRSLRRAEATFYAESRFAEVFASCVRAPLDLTPRLAEIPGVATVETRVAVPVTLDMPRYDEPIRGQLLSLPTQLGVPLLREGSFPLAAGEALVNEPFARAHELHAGSIVRVNIEGREQRFVVSGIALSPEFVFAIAPGQATPDDARYGILWADRLTVASAYRMEGAFNDVVMRLSPHASEGAVIAATDALLARYGGFPAVGRDEQSSHRFVKNELEELRTWAIILPSIFVGVAGFLLNIVLARLVGTQREQIAALKAFGYTNARVGLHYLEMIAVIVLLGAALGTALGAFLGSGLTIEYRKYFRFPGLDYRLEPQMVALAGLFSFAIGALGGLHAVRLAVRLAPAEAMRPPAPPRYRRSLLERLGLGAFLSNIGRIVVRNVGRRPLRAAASVVGIAFATAIIVVAFFFHDVIGLLMNHQFGRVMRDDMTVVLRNPADTSVVTELAHVPGVLRVEPTRMMPIRVLAGHREKRVLLLGLLPNAELRTIRTLDGTPVELPPNGLMLTTWLAEQLGVGVGDAVQIEALEGAHVLRETRVRAVVEEMFGQQTYMRFDALHALLGEQPTVSAALLTVDPRSAVATREALKSKPAVIAVTRREAILDSFRQTTGGWMNLVSSILSAFAATITFGVVYNTARINFAERERELASLRVLGFTVGEITTIFVGELATLVVLGIPVGFLLGWALGWLMIRATGGEGFRFPLHIEADTFALAAVIVSAAAVVSVLIVRRGLDRLDLVSVLKTRD